jgi:serine/threonine protein kinase
VNRRGKKDGELLVFSYESVSAATNNFSAVNKLGQGGFGPVYKVYVIYSLDECASKLLQQPIMVNFHESLKNLWFSFNS